MHYSHETSNVFPQIYIRDDVYIIISFLILLEIILENLFDSNKSVWSIFIINLQEVFIFYIVFHVLFIFPLESKWGLRHIIGLLGFFAVGIGYIQRFCLSLAITEMVGDTKHTKIDELSCPYNATVLTTTRYVSILFKHFFFPSENEVL